MKDNSHSRNQKKRWMEGLFIGESSRNGVQIWEGLAYKDKEKLWKDEEERENRKRYSKMPRLTLAHPTMGLSLSSYGAAVPADNED